MSGSTFFAARFARGILASSRTLIILSPGICSSFALYDHSTARGALAPTYAFFVRVLGWGGTWLPLIVRQMFGTAYNVFRLRHYFMTIPREMDEAAMIDGARIFTSVILPQAVPDITAVAMFHSFFAWNEFFRSVDLFSRQP